MMSASNTRIADHPKNVWTISVFLAVLWCKKFEELVPTTPFFFFRTFDYLENNYIQAKRFLVGFT